MTGASARATPEQTIALAEKVAEILERHDLVALVIGGVALAVHNYPRATRDLDLGVAVSLSQLRAVRDELDECGFETELRTPDGVDPLGGVIDIEDENGAIVQVINFDNPPGQGFPRVIVDAVAASKPPPEGTRLRIVPLPHLIALKLYAGGPQSVEDIRGLLRSNPDADVAAIRELCATYRKDRAFDSCFT